jgi:hypothetical protein
MARRRGLLSPIARVRYNAFHKGLIGGSRGWMMAGGVVVAGRFVRRALGRNEEIVAIEVLKPGQAVRLEAISPLTRRARRSAKRAS